MQPHIDEAWRSLRLADRDITAFHILRSDPAAHVSIINFHAQQAVEKSLKAVLVTRVREWAEEQVGDTSNPDRLEEEYST
jgi:hypothetical protein